MWDKDKLMEEDTLSIGNGIWLGLILGTLIWAILIGGFFYYYN